jgi:hypothetical protein
VDVRFSDGAILRIGQSLGGGWEAPVVVLQGQGARTLRLTPGRPALSVISTISHRGDGSVSWPRSAATEDDGRNEALPDEVRARLTAARAFLRSLG